MLRRVPLIVILGSTGTGKTKLSIELARIFNAEIISADSMQVINFETKNILWQPTYKLSNLTSSMVFKNFFYTGNKTRESVSIFMISEIIAKRWNILYGSTTYLGSGVYFFFISHVK